MDDSDDSSSSSDSRATLGLEGNNVDDDVPEEVESPPKRRLPDDVSELSVGTRGTKKSRHTLNSVTTLVLEVPAKPAFPPLMATVDLQQPVSIPRNTKGSQKKGCKTVNNKILANGAAYLDLCDWTEEHHKKCNMMVTDYHSKANASHKACGKAIKNESKMAERVMKLESQVEKAKASESTNATETKELK